MRKITKDEIGILIMVFIIGLIGGYFIFNNSDENLVKSLIQENNFESDNNLIVNESETKEDQKKVKEIKEIKVYITGSIKKPGVYNMNEEDRVIDIFQKAGGESIGANLDQINMAAHLQDGEKIYIPNLSEIPKRKKLSANNFKSSFNNSKNKININTADQSELEKLSGIGPSKASSIIKYRSKNGNFSSVKELIKVSGIGKATLNNIEDEVIIR